MVDEDDVFVGVSYLSKLQYEELKKVIDRSANSFNKFKVDNDKYESLLSSLSSDLKGIHESFEKIFNDFNNSSVETKS
jgi:hypothetical protein